MANPMTVGEFTDAVDPRFRKIWMGWTPPPTSMRKVLFTTETSKLADERESQIEPFGRPSEFGTTSAQGITYQGLSQGYNVIATPREWASGAQVQRKLVDDEQYGVIDRIPVALREGHEDLNEHNASRLFRLAFSVDTFFFTHSENVALCSNSHTNRSGASTAVGFDNLTTTALSAVNLTAMRILGAKFRNPNALRTNFMADTLLVPPDLYDVGYEITGASGKVDTALNNPNIHQGQFRLIVWDYLTGDANSETNNYFLIDSQKMAQHVAWIQRVPLEDALSSDFDTMMGKYRTYERNGMKSSGWRWVVGANVA